MSAENSTSNFLDMLKETFSNSRFIKLTLGKPTKAANDLKNVFIKPVTIKDKIVLSFVYRHPTNDITKNFPLTEAIETLNDLLGKAFLSANLFTEENDVQLIFNKKREPKLILSKPTQSQLQAFTHDRIKTRLIKTEDNLYLQKLGITNQQFEVIPRMQDKFRQINKYVELVDAMLGNEEITGTLKVADMGSGKGYLTFSLYDHLVNNRKMAAQITGVELRQELVAKCNQIAGEAGFEHLRFVTGSISDYDASGINMLIALHACDTATDDAILRGITAGAKYIVVAPCCHKQVRKAMQPPENLMPILRHGIFAERQAELITDALRALIMEKFGYQTRVFEFISTKHTPKNLMIIGVKTGKIVNKVSISEQIHQIKSFYGIEHHYLEDRLEGYEQIVG